MGLLQFFILQQSHLHILYSISDLVFFVDVDRSVLGFIFLHAKLSQVFQQGIQRSFVIFSNMGDFIQQFLERIKTVDIANINKVVDAVLRRYSELFPDWEISTVSVERNLDRNKQLDAVIQTLQNMKESSYGGS